MNSYKMQQDYSTREQRKSPRAHQSIFKLKNLPSKFKQALFWMTLGLLGGLLVNYISSPKPVELAEQQAESQPLQQLSSEKSTPAEENTRVIQLELPAAG